MTKVRTIIAGVDTPDDHGPVSVLAVMGVPPLAEEDRADLARFTEEIAALRVHQEPPSESVGLDGMTVHGWYRHAAGQLHDFRFWFRQPERPRSQFVRQVYALAVELLQDERSVRVLESLHGYLHLGLPVKQVPGPPYVVRIFGRLTASDGPALEASLAQVPPEVPLLLDLSNFDGMGTALHPVFQDFLRRSGPTVCWAAGEQARMHLGRSAFRRVRSSPTREEALAMLGPRDPALLVFRAYPPNRTECYSDFGLG